ncbi:hypothetical protein [Proteiniclasticum ruminis]|nr:hypothetical protein [Proteiniclasticum ruminis]
MGIFRKQKKEDLKKKLFWKKNSNKAFGEEEPQNNCSEGLLYEDSR